MKAKLVLISGLVAIATASQAVIFITNMQFAPLGSGATLSSAGNSVSFSSATAVGDSLPARFAIFTYQYDAKSNAGDIATIRLNFSGIVEGSGFISVREDIYKLDVGGNEIGGLFQTFNAVSQELRGSFTQSQSFDLVGAGSSIRVKKTILLNAVPNTQDFDLAGLSYVNQSVEAVPEPASMLALGLGLACIARRRKLKV